MKCLTRSECSEWLKRNNLVESPYQKCRENLYVQFEAPGKPRRLTAFARRLMAILGPFSGALILFEDWSPCESDAMALIDAIRRGYDERRFLIDAPGHLFESTEADQVIGLCYLTLLFGWTAYLYLPQPVSATVLFWEGDLMDVWVQDGDMRDGVREMVKEFELRVTFPKSDAAT